jgi:hypothetical protein
MMLKLADAYVISRWNGLADRFAVLYERCRSQTRRAHTLDVWLDAERSMTNAWLIIGEDLGFSRDTTIERTMAAAQRRLDHLVRTIECEAPVKRVIHDQFGPIRNYRLPAVGFISAIRVENNRFHHAVTRWGGSRGPL